jgi:NAD(P) transhydrogenase subunit alpha
MKPGSVIVDMAAEMGGNCELTKPNEAYVHEDYKVTIVGFTDLLSRMAPVTSELYAVNIEHLLEELGGAKDFDID